MNRTIGFVLLALLAAAPGRAQAPKIGYVNSEKIFQELPEAQEAERRLGTIAAPVRQEIERREGELQGKIEDYRKKQGMMNEPARKAAEDEIVTLQQSYRAYAAEKDSMLRLERDRLTAPLRNRILAAIEKVAKEERYSFVFDKLEQASILLYGDPAHDLTFKVIDRLKRGK
ncbi:MAG: OmpH family outer membrane protein [Bacteroidota bacterium]